MFVPARSSLPGIRARETFIEFPHGTATGAMGRATGQGRRDPQPLGLPDGSHGPPRPRFCRPASTASRRPPSAMEVFDRIARGDTFYYTLVVPEGRNMFDIATEAGQFGAIYGPRIFLAAARNPALIQDLDPAAPSLEGYLFPDTYKLTRHTTPESLCRTMTAKFSRGLDAPQRYGESARDRYDGLAGGAGREAARGTPRWWPPCSKTACASA